MNELGNEQNWIRAKAYFSQNLNTQLSIRNAIMAIYGRTILTLLTINLTCITFNIVVLPIYIFLIPLIYSEMVTSYFAIVSFFVYNYLIFKLSYLEFNWSQDIMYIPRNTNPEKCDTVMSLLMEHLAEFGNNATPSIFFLNLYFDKTTGITSLPLCHNVVYGPFGTFGGAIQKFPQGDLLDVPINYLHLPPKIGDNVFLSTNIEEMTEKCPKAFSSGPLGRFHALEIEEKLASEKERAVFIGFPGKMTLPNGEEKEDFLLGIRVREEDIDQFLSDPVFAKTDIAKRIASVYKNIF